MHTQVWSSHYHKNRAANQVQEAADSLAAYRAAHVTSLDAKEHKRQGKPVGNGDMCGGEVAKQGLLVQKLNSSSSSSSAHNSNSSTSSPTSSSHNSGITSPAHTSNSSSPTSSAHNNSSSCSLSSEGTINTSTNTTTSSSSNESGSGCGTSEEEKEWSGMTNSSSLEGWGAGESDDGDALPLAKKRRVEDLFTFG